MDDYAACRAKKPLCLTVRYEPGDARPKDKYTWDIASSIPTSHLVGFIVRVQAELAFRAPAKCEDGFCVIAFDPAAQTMSWFVDPTIPVDCLVGVLELIKTMLIDGQVAATLQAQKSNLVLPRS